MHTKSFGARIGALALIALLGTGFGAATVLAQDTDTDTAVLMKLFSTDGVTKDAFADSFLGQVPFDRVTGMLDQMRGVTGAAVSAEKVTGDDFLVHTESHDIPVTLVRDEDGRITGLLVQPPVAANTSLEDALAAITALDGTSAYLVTRNGEPLHSFAADAPLAVGSAFKLGVLAATRDRMQETGDGWDTVVRLRENEMSLPSGMLHTFPVGAPLTLGTLAAMMISISDNTATDVLVDYAGRRAVAARLGLDFVLKTRELFLLKADEGLRADYLAADAEGRYAMTQTFDEMPPPPAGKVSGQHVSGVEFYVPLDRLCALMSEVADLDVMAINPGIANPADWAHIAYKGGSERGVLNFTTQVRTAAGDSYCVAATWNADTEIPETAAISAYAGLLKALANDAGDGSD